MITNKDNNRITKKINNNNRKDRIFLIFFILWNDLSLSSDTFSSKLNNNEPKDC